MAVTSSPRASVVTPDRTKHIVGGDGRTPAGPATTTRAPNTSRAGTVSAAGEALQMFPASVARFRIWTAPTTAAASASAWWSRRIRSSATMSVITASAPIVSPLAVTDFPDLRVELLDPFHVDHDPRPDGPVTEPDDQVRPTRQRTRLRPVLVQQRDSVVEMVGRSYAKARIAGPRAPDPSRRGAPAAWPPG